MPIITLSEVIGLIVVAFYISYIFSGFIKKPRNIYDEDYSYKNQLWEDMKFSAMIVVPAVILHEMAHKFIAMFLGFESAFYGFYYSSWTMTLAIISIFLRIFHAPFIILVPGFVGIPPNVDPLSTGIIAFAGPLTNLIMFFIADYIIKNKQLNRNQLILATLTKKINIFLFIFNMIPIAPFDGGKVLTALFSLF
jgi:Zn-dependent protease